MSTIKTTYLQHPSSSSPNLTLAADGSMSGGAGLGGLVHIATESFTAVSSVSLNNVFSSNYQNYLVFINPTASSANQGLYLRYRASGTDATGTDFSYAGRDIGVTGSAGDIVGSNSLSYMPLGASSSTFNQTAIELVIWNPYIAAYTMSRYSTWQYDGSSTYFRNMGARHNQTVSYDGFTFYPNTGTITGSLRVYGYRNS